MNLNILHNKVFLINIIVVASVLIVIILLNTPTQIDYEELTTIPYDYIPNPYIKGWIPKQLTVDIKQPELFTVDHAVYTATDEIPISVITTTEQQPYPMSPASSILACNSIQPNDTVLVLAIKKMDTTPAVYAVTMNNNTICYFSDPFPTGYNSLVLFVKIDDSNNKEITIKIEIRKVSELG